MWSGIPMQREISFVRQGGETKFGDSYDLIVFALLES